MSKLPLSKILDSYNEINQKLAKTSDTEELIKLSKEQKKLQIQANLATQIQKLEKEITSNQDLLKDEELDEELKKLTIEDNQEKQIELEKLENHLLIYLTPQDSKDDSNIILEIRAGAGGDESSLFASDLLRMYKYLAEKLEFDFKIVSQNINTLGGFKEVIVEIRGDSPYSWFKYEGGVHRVQRVPTTEKQGRIHTSTCSVAIMPLFEDNNQEFKLDPKDIEIITTTSRGHGGQSVNTTYSAVKLKHLPTGIEAQCQDERNQQQNKAKAMIVLTARVFDYYEQERLAKEISQRRIQVGRGDRNEKIKTYNFPQDRLTDHRYSKSWNQLENILNGQIYDILEEIKQIEAKLSLEELQ